MYVQSLIERKIYFKGSENIISTTAAVLLKVAFKLVIRHNKQMLKGWLISYSYILYLRFRNLLFSRVATYVTIYVQRGII